jgi:hypothetical protein
MTPGLPAFLPSGSGWDANNPSSEYLYNSTTNGTLVSINLTKFCARMGFSSHS